MVDLNSVTLSGRITADSVQRMTNSGKELTSFAIACNDDYKNKNTGEWVNRAYFFNCVIWKPIVLKKGEPVIVTGKLETNTEEYNGEKRTYIKISANRVMKVIVEKKNSENTAQSDTQQQDNRAVEEDDTPPF